MSTNISAFSGFKFLYCLSKPGDLSFQHSLKGVERIQKNKLSKLLGLSENTEFGKRFGLSKAISYGEFTHKVPETDYEYWQEMVDKQRKSDSLVISGQTPQRYQPTSGSSAKIKWIPYTRMFLDELNKAISAMLVNAFHQNKGILKGRHYWSISWIPTELRSIFDQDTHDDMKLLPWWKRKFINSTMVVPSSVATCKTSQGSTIATLAYLAAAEDLALISVWSPTFALNLLDQLASYQDEISLIIKYGHWGKWHNELAHLHPPQSKKASDILKSWDGKVESRFLRELWPNLAMLSSWDSSTSKIWAEKLKQLFPWCDFLPKGLWSTEGVVSIFYNNSFPLAVNSHFLEFKDLDSGRIYPAWNLQQGQYLSPLLSTGSGFFRYNLKDRLLVTGHLKNCPCFEFQGREDTVDMVGEKMSSTIALEVLQEVKAHFQVNALSLIALSSKGRDKPGYLILCEHRQDPELEKKISNFAEELLVQSFHYNLAVEVGQLAPLQALLTPWAQEIYQKRAQNRNIVLGDMKIEPLILWDESDGSLDLTPQQSREATAEHI